MFIPDMMYSENTLGDLRGTWHNVVVLGRNIGLNVHTSKQMIKVEIPL
jgi:hypothetical protein